jgi:uncharacterized protein (DUF1015 family)
MINIQKANMEPVIFTYSEVPYVEEFLEKVSQTTPHLEAQMGGFVSKVWKLSSEESDFLAQHFENVNELYITDGHHRMQSAANVA